MTSHEEFGAETTATQVAVALRENINGRNVVVTGVGPASIGYTTVLAIASQSPAKLILASRTKKKLDAVAADIAKVYPGVDVRTVTLDLAAVASVKAAAATIAGLVDHIDVLINNAGISTPERHPLTAPDGRTLDSQFFTNHIGVFLFTALLLPQLRAAAVSARSNGTKKGATRVVNLTSQGHRLSPVRFSDYAFEKDIYEVPESEKPASSIPPFFAKTVDGYPGFLAYGQSKSANILHASELSRRFSAHGDDIVALSVHPGTIETELSRSLDKEGLDTINKTAPKGVWKTQDQGSATTLVAAFDPALGAVGVGSATVGYLSDCQLHDDMVAPHAARTDAAKRLWEESERFLQFSVGL
ncbi:NAD(P)-binding domain protein [Niveomyces insectorum RCEF 264]|uniref:NAD(P)-binding domain protein n=1 Tax=Niveomyces insectorum RCEF 264 TaxID=1081102 RepID=A0A167PWW5_9HYPO|nr:NAD(P)-binding domain protein [Niveomyces insectorum RCEF 264]